jgi:hypothetical protein
VATGDRRRKAGECHVHVNGRAISSACNEPLRRARCHYVFLSQDRLRAAPSSVGVFEPTPRTPKAIEEPAPRTLKTSFIRLRSLELACCCFKNSSEVYRQRTRRCPVPTRNPAYRGNKRQRECHGADRCGLGFASATRSPASHTRNARSTAALVLVQAGIVPTKIAALGIEFSTSDQRVILRVAAFVIAYFLISFFIYAMNDFIAWNTELRGAMSEWLKGRFIERGGAASQSENRLPRIVVDRSR